MAEPRFTHSLRREKTYEPVNLDIFWLNEGLISEKNNLSNLLEMLETLDNLVIGDAVYVHNSDVFNYPPDIKGTVAMGDIGIFEKVNSKPVLNPPHVGIELIFEEGTCAKVVRDTRTGKTHFESEAYHDANLDNQYHVVEDSTTAILYGGSKLASARKVGGNWDLRRINGLLRPYNLDASTYVKKINR